MNYLSGPSLPVYDKHTQERLTTIATASARDMENAIARGHAAMASCKALSGYERQRILQHIVVGIRKKQDLFSRLLSQEVGKTPAEAEAEVIRAIDTFAIAAEESVRIGGETLPMDRSPRGQNKWGMTRRFPIGLCALIAPFNFPLNLAAHKIAPAIAAGCPFILKPASATPLTALLLKDILATAGLPEGSWAVLPASREVADTLITDPRIALLSFTGSPDVGWDMKCRAGKKKVVLELGGNAACIVDETADLDIAIPKIVSGAFTQAGQSCISVQRVYLHETQFQNAVVMMSGMAKQFKTGPMISKTAADRLMSWINDAIAQGAMCHCGAQQDGASIYPTLLSQVPKTSPLACQEAFGPVMCVTPFSDFKDALTAVNDSSFGLQAGIFTTLMSRAHQAFETLDVGGVIIQDVPSLRFDHMPYGGIKDSGFGREGVRYAILEDYTYEKILVY